MERLRVFPRSYCVDKGSKVGRLLKLYGYGALKGLLQGLICHGGDDDLDVYLAPEKR